MREWMNAYENEVVYEYEYGNEYEYANEYGHQYEYGYEYEYGMNMHDMQRNEWLRRCMNECFNE